MPWGHGLRNEEGAKSWQPSVMHYAGMHSVHRRDGFRCRYCGLDGTESFSKWLSLSQDHLLPVGHDRRNDPDFIVTACRSCNEADNHYFEHAMKRGLLFDDLTPEQLIAQRLHYVKATRASYREFWIEQIAIQSKGE